MKQFCIHGHDTALYGRNKVHACKQCAYEVQKVFRHNRRQFIQSFKSKPCTDCGIKYKPWQMQFDHLQNKLFVISNHMNRSKTRILKEISKCDIVCANCHADRSHRRQMNETNLRTLLNNLKEN